MSKHLSHVEVERFDAVALPEREVGIAGRFAYHIQRSTLTLGNAAHVFDVLFVDEQSHALLTLIGYDFLARQRLVADGQFGHVDFSTTFLYQFRQTVDMSGRAVVVDADNRVHIFLAECAHQVVGTFLHLGVGTLHSIQFDAVAVSTDDTLPPPRPMR